MTTLVPGNGINQLPNAVHGLSGASNPTPPPRFLPGVPTAAPFASRPPPKNQRQFPRASTPLTTPSSSPSPGTSTMPPPAPPPHLLLSQQEQLRPTPRNHPRCWLRRPSPRKTHPASHVEAFKGSSHR
ncbi:hypothetical protein T484DRAFT_1988909 [Baffinella frigidus]|nr:hypothetical protein T484DRAFT_1988909 [Cryptophyta sp. CCMP2293]